MFMHEQLVLVGAQPIALERVSTYRGLNSRSIRVRHSQIHSISIAHLWTDIARAHGI